MAHVAKFTRSGFHALVHHNLRHKDRTGKFVAFGGSAIDTQKTHLNYRLDESEGKTERDAFEAVLEKMNKRLSEVHVSKRADLKVYCSWVVTAPDSLPREKLKDFFQSAYAFLEAEVGKENTLMASVHMDETTPHMHFGFIPVVKERKNQKKLGMEKVCVKELITKDYLKTFHNRLKNVIERDLGCRVDILLPEEENAPKRTYGDLKEFKKKSLKETKELRQELAQLVPEVQELKAEKEKLALQTMPSIAPPELPSADGFYRPSSYREKAVEALNAWTSAVWPSLKTLMAKASDNDFLRAKNAELERQNAELKRRNAELSEKNKQGEIAQKLVEYIRKALAPGVFNTLVNGFKSCFQEKQKPSQTPGLDR